MEAINIKYSHIIPTDVDQFSKITDFNSDYDIMNVPREFYNLINLQRIYIYNATMTTKIYNFINLVTFANVYIYKLNDVARYKLKKGDIRVLYILINLPEIECVLYGSFLEFELYPIHRLGGTICDYYSITDEKYCRFHFF